MATPLIYGSQPIMPLSGLELAIGSATVKTRDSMGFRALDNLDSYFAGKTPEDLL